jgi:hypothetical protein
MRRLLPLLLSAMLLTACSKPVTTKTKTVMDVADVPRAVMTAAKKKEPHVKFDKVIKAPNGIYEVQGKNSAGKIIEVEVSESGDVLKVE